MGDRVSHPATATTLDGRRAVRLASPAHELEATVVPSAGMVVASLRHRGEELLGQRGGLAAYLERGSTFGIPLLHPWANRLGGETYGPGHEVRIPEDAPLVRREEHGLPIHGLLAASPCWTVEAAGGDATVAAMLDFGAHSKLLAVFPFPHRLRLEVALHEDTLRLSLALTATGVIPVPLAFGFHPYLRLPGLEREAWTLELPERDELEADDRGIPTGASARTPATSLTLGDRSIDQGLDGLATGARFALTGGGRRLEVTFEDGYPAGQLFAPAAADVVCFEPMAARTDALRSGRGLRAVVPGATASASFSVRVGAQPG